MPQSLVSGIECLPPTFHDSAGLVADALVLKASRLNSPALTISEVHGDDQLRIPVHGDVGSVSGNDHLPSALAGANLPDDQVVDQLIVEIILGLVKNQRFRTA